MANENASANGDAAGAGGDGPTGAAPGAAQGADGNDVRRVIWNDADMASTFANVVNVLNTREEFTLLFGTNRTWNMTDGGDVTVDLSNRIVLTPYAAKRLMALLQARVDDYEKRYGKMQF